jgi:hypothetical protein
MPIAAVQQLTVESHLPPFEEPGRDSRTNINVLRLEVKYWRGAATGEIMNRRFGRDDLTAFRVVLCWSASP